MTGEEQEIYDEGYARGQKSVGPIVSSSIANALVSAGLIEPGDPLAELARAKRETFETRNALRSIFEEYKWDWPGDELYLPDVVEKHLARTLSAEFEELR